MIIMRRRLITAVAVLLVSVATMFAKDLREVTFKVSQMECANCEKKVKDNIRFEKGLKALDTDLEAKTVTIQYDPEKTSVEKLQDGFKKIKYETEVVSDKAVEKSKKK